MTIPLSVKKQNALLARELGYEHGHARYAWCWANDLMAPMVLMDDESKVIYDYFCACGRNMSVHSATCSWTQAKPKWEMRCLAPNHLNRWVLCRWLPPQASREDWLSTFPIPYPEGGTFEPVGDPEKRIAINEGQVPFTETTELCISRIKEHFSVSARQRTKETEQQWAENTEHLREDLRLRCRDAFPVHEGFPGEKHGWSHGGDPATNSPNVRRIITPDEASARPSEAPIVLA